MGNRSGEIQTRSGAWAGLEDCGLHDDELEQGGQRYGGGVMGPLARFAKRETHTLRVQSREDEFTIDQIVLSSGTYLNASPGALRSDAMILPACPAPPLR